MKDKKTFKELYETKIESSKEKYLRSEIDRISSIVEDQDGKIVIKKSSSLPKSILEYIIGCATAFFAGKRETDVVTNKDLYQKFPGEDKGKIRANLSNLKGRFIKKTNSGEHRIIYSKISEALDYILGEEE